MRKSKTLQLALFYSFLHEPSLQGLSPPPARGCLTPTSFCATTPQRPAQQFTNTSLFLFKGRGKKKIHPTFANVCTELSDGNYQTSRGATRQTTLNFSGRHFKGLGKRLLVTCPRAGTGQLQLQALAGTGVTSLSSPPSHIFETCL